MSRMKHARLCTLILLAIATGTAPRAVGLNVPADNGAKAQSTGPAIVDDGDAGWVWSGFSEYDDPQLRGGGGHAGGPSNYGVYTFHGTGVQVYAMRGDTIEVDGRRHRIGGMQISIDGHLKAAPSLHELGDYDYNYRAFGVEGLSDGVHVLKIDPQDGWVVIDYIVIQNGDSATDLGQDAKTTSKPATGDQFLELPQGDYRIYPRVAPGSSLDDKDWVTTDGSPLQIWESQQKVQQNQLFHVTPLGKGKYWMAPLNGTTQAVTMLQPLPDNTAPAGLWRYMHAPAQIWIVTNDNDGWCRLSPSNAPDIALTVSGGATANGTGVTCAPWRDQPSQEWAFGVQ